jgi:hypothetical protein
LYGDGFAALRGEFMAVMKRFKVASPLHVGKVMVPLEFRNLGNRFGTRQQKREQPLILLAPHRSC